MKDKVFLDTNIFIYSIDSSPGEAKKSEVAQQLVKDYIQNEMGVISIQVLQEFYQVTTSKIQTPLSTERALEYLNYISIMETVHPDFNMIVSAIHIHKAHSVSFWDALIIQAAKTADCQLLLSEDLQDGFCLENLTIKNPFKLYENNC